MKTTPDSHQPATRAPGRLLLIPNTLDLGCIPEGAPQPDLRDVIPHAAIVAASQLTHWVAENAKTTRAFLKRVDAITPLSAPLQQLDIQVLPRPAKGGQTLPPPSDKVWQSLLAPALAGHDLGLISEAGLPGVADPGADLVLAAHAAGVKVVPMSGPSSLILAVAASGLNGQSFAFVGYLPTDAAQRAQRIKALEVISSKQRQTQLVIETPYRNEALWGALTEHLSPETWLSVSCGLTLESGWSQTLRVKQWRQKPLSFPNDTPAVFSWLAA
jgi:16S rRNA (cytidine1402-2'-O)-methyltransferase